MCSGRKAVVKDINTNPQLATVTTRQHSPDHKYLTTQRLDWCRPTQSPGLVIFYALLIFVYLSVIRIPFLQHSMNSLETMPFPAASQIRPSMTT